jgi:hypothetical protein
MVKEVLIAAKIAQWELSGCVEPAWSVEPDTFQKWNPATG